MQINLTFRDLEKAVVTSTVYKQLPISDASKKRLIIIRTGIYNDNVEQLAQDVYEGKITLSQWEAKMRDEIRGLYTSNAVIGKGGWDEMTWSDWGKLGNPLKAQYKYLHTFAEKLDKDSDTVSLAYIKARARLYGRKGGYAAILIEAGSDVRKALNWLPKDDSTECDGSCKCHWELEVTDELSDVQRVTAIWRISEAEHCKDCLERNGYTQIFDVPLDVRVPAQIGGY